MAKKRAQNKEQYAAAYIRISTDEDLQKWSLGGQEKELLELAKCQDFIIYKIYKDTISGSRSSRPGLDQLRDDMAAGKFSIILVVDQDRLSRMEPMDWELLKHEIKEAGVRLVTPVQEIDFSDEDNELVSDVFNLFARHQRRKLKKAMMRGRAEAVENGNWFGKPPYGRKKIKNNGGKNQITVDPVTGPVVQKIFYMYDEGYGSKIIADELNRLGIPAPEGGTWDNCAVLRVISHPIHRGDLRRCENGRNIYVGSAFDSTVPVALFDRCQKILQRRSEGKTWQRLNTVTSLAASSLICDECQQTLQVLPIHSKYRNKQYSYYYYRHRSRNRNGDTVKPACDAVHRVDRVDTKIIEAIKLVASSPAVVQRLIEIRNTDKERNTLTTRLEALNKSEKQLTAKKEKLLTLFLDDDWDKATLKKRRKSLEAELKNVGNEQQNILSQLTQIEERRPDLELTINCFVALANMEEEMSRQQQRKLIQALFPKIEIAINGDMRIYALIPAKDILNHSEEGSLCLHYCAQGI